MYVSARQFLLFLSVVIVSLALLMNTAAAALLITSTGGNLLLADQHPLAGQDARLADDHRLELLLAGQLAACKEGGLVADASDGMLYGHGLASVTTRRASQPQVSCLVAL